MFEVRFHARAAKAYARLDAKRKRQINRSIDSLRVNPLDTANVAPLRGELAGLYRLRVGDYRIVFTVLASEKAIFVLALGPRGDIYK